MGKTRVLFLCTGNSARSQMAEAFLRAFAGDEYEAYSAGLEPRGINPLTIAVMKERGIDISGQRSKGLHEYLGRQHFGVLITVCDRAEKECPIFPGVGTRLHWSFPDPSTVQGTEEERLAAFRDVRDDVEQRLCEWLAQRAQQPASERGASQNA